jgi:hypothetical protein
MPRLLDVSAPTPAACALVTSVMLWPGPDDLARRHQHVAVQLIRDETKHLRDNESFCLKVHMLRAAIDAPAPASVQKEVMDITKKAHLAGYVLLFNFVLRRWQDVLPKKRGASGASLNKAFFLIGEWANSGATFGDGHPIRASGGLVKQSWSVYRSVSHLWAAYIWNNQFAEGDPVLRGSSALKPEGLVQFLRTAAFFMSFGHTLKLDNRSGSASSTLLDPDDVWQIDFTAFPPHAPMPLEEEVTQAPFVAWLRTYKAT